MRDPDARKLYSGKLGKWIIVSPNNIGDYRTYHQTEIDLLQNMDEEYLRVIDRAKSLFRGRVIEVTDYVPLPPVVRMPRKEVDAVEVIEQGKLW